MTGLLLLLALQLGGPPPERSVTVTPGARFRAGPVHRFLLGDTHRDLWNTPIRVPVLDLGTFGGGLAAVERGGSKQTRSLRFQAQDGRTLVFRALEKDPTQTWPEMLRRSPARSLADDQISALLPAGALAVSALEAAAGLLHVRPELFVLPDDPRLGEWREEFRGNVGLLEQRVRGRGEAVTATFGAQQVVATDALFERLRADGANQVDERAYLAARLFDLFVGDWDRHADQWTWARFESGPLRIWRPVPRDRDWALSRLDGPLYGLLRLYMPKYQSFGNRYGSIYGLTLSAEPLDRRLLVWLDRAAWDSVVVGLMARLDDAAIDSAASLLPAEFGAEPRAALARSLRARRDALPRAATRFYRQLAGTVDLAGSDRPERVTLEREADGAVTATLEAMGEPATRRRRRFDPSETGEIRVHARGGDDAVAVSGAGPPRIRLRIVGGEGSDRVTSDGSPVIVYDDTGTAGLSAVTTLRTRPHRPATPPDAPDRLARDWGARWSVDPWFEVAPEIGLLLGGGPVLYRYGFRKEPYAARLALRVAHATGRGGLNADLQADIRFERPDLRLLIRAAALELDVAHYFGVGNETPRTEPAGYYRILQRDLLLEPTLDWRVAPRTHLRLGAFLRSASTDLEEPTLLGAERPLGSGRFRLAGLAASWAFDSRDLVAYPTRGLHLRAAVRAVPGLLDVPGGFLSGRVDGSGYLTARGLPATPTLALRAGAARVSGTAPFFEAAAVGGAGSIRGLSSRRFMGDGAVYGGAELRLDLGGFRIAVPGDWGVFALADGGRVFAEGEASRRWHGAAGGGLWFAFLDRRSTMSVAVARGDRRTRAYLRAGVAY